MIGKAHNTTNQAGSAGDCTSGAQASLPWRRGWDGLESLLAESFDQIRSIAKGDVVIMSRILGAFQTLAGMSNSTIAAVKKGEKQ